VNEEHSERMGRQATANTHLDDTFNQLQLLPELVQVHSLWMTFYVVHILTILKSQYINYMMHNYYMPGCHSPVTF